MIITGSSDNYSEKNNILRFLIVAFDDDVFVVFTSSDIKVDFFISL